MTEHPDEPLPRFAFLFPESAAQVGQDEEFMGQTAFAKIAPAHAPAAAAAGKGEGERCVFIGIETGREAQIGRPAAKQFVDRLAEQILAGAINETKAAVR